MKHLPNYLLLILCLFANLSLAQQFTNQPQINIVTEHLPPFQIASKDKVLGFATDIVSLAMSNTPYSFDIKVYPWSRSYNLAISRENTCIYSIARTPEREHLFTWVNTIAERDSSFISLKERKLTINSIEDAKQYTTAVIRDDVTHQLLLSEGFKEGVNLYVVNNTYSLLKLLALRKSIDLILVDAQTIKYRAQFNQLDHQLFESVLQLNKLPLDYYFACNLKTSPLIIGHIREAITQLKTTGQLKQLIDQWQYPKIKVK